MITIGFDNVAYFDVDDTLIMYGPFDPARSMEIKIAEDRPSVWVTPNETHIDQIKRHKAWGNGVVVWSKSGHEWAMTVVKALDLESYVDVVMAKPTYFYDDKHCCQILGEHRYLKDK